MRTSATLLMIAIGCGGARQSSPAPSEATSPTTAAAAESPEPVASAPAAAPAPAASPTDQSATAAAATPAAATPAAATTARAELKMLSGDKALGTMTFERKDKVISISGTFSGMKKGTHALYIHDKGDCSDKGRKVGGHLNPTKAKHGPPASAMRHAGDFGDLAFDKEGNATFAMETDSVTMEPGRADSVVGRAVVVYSRKDSKSGKAGSPIACGVVVLEGASPATETSSTPPATATPTSAASR